MAFYLSVGLHCVNRFAARAVNIYLSIDIDEGRSAPLLATARDEEGVGFDIYEPDILAAGLEMVFCGLNPATTAAAAGHNFSSSSRSNRFWTVLHFAGFTDVRLQPHEERRLLDYRCGLTAVVDRPTRRATDVSPEEFRKARPGFEAKMRRYAPRSIAFLGKRVFSAMIDQSDVEWGRHTRFAGTTAWVLPNPSGLNKAFTLDVLWRLADGPPRRTVAAGVLVMVAADDTHRDRRAG